MGLMSETGSGAPDGTKGLEAHRLKRTGRALRILLVEDRSADRALARLALLHELPGASVEEVSDALGFSEALHQGQFDLVIAAHALGWADGLAILQPLKERWPEIPFILFADGDTQLAIEAIKAGADDYIVKSSEGYLMLGRAAVAAVDRTEQRRQISRHESRLHTLLNRAKVGVFRATLDGRLIEASPALQRMLGVGSLEEALSLGLDQLYYRSKEPGELRNRVTESGEIHRQVVELRRADGQPIWVSLTEALTLESSGEVTIEGLMEDVTERKHSEAELARSAVELKRSNADLQQFASVAAHELQEPLRMVERYLKTLSEKSRGQPDEVVEHCLSYSHHGVRRMQSLIDNLLAFSRLATQGRALKRCDSGEAVRRALANLKGAVEDSGAELRYEALPAVHADPAQLVLLFQNLISNAIKFGGEATPRIQISAEPRSGEWQFAIRDNGIGIEPEDRESVFALFKRLHSNTSGSGIGLSICKRIVERHGGRIWIDSIPGKGSIFYFTIPEAAPSSQEEAAR